MEPNKLIKLLRELKRDDVMVVLTNESIDSLIDIVEKYQKIAKILKDDTYYEEYGNNAEKFIVSAICEVIEDGRT